MWPQCCRLQARPQGMHLHSIHGPYQRRALTALASEEAADADTDPLAKPNEPAAFADTEIDWADSEDWEEADIWMTTF